MQNRSFLTPILLFLCLIVICIIGAGVVTSIDRQRFQTEQLTKAVADLSDRIAARSGGKNRLLLQAAGLLLASPCIVLMGASHSFPAVCAALAGFGLFRGVFDSSLLTAFYEVIPPKYYSTSVALLFFFGNATGALSPWILGIISDRMGLSVGIVSLSAVWVAGSVAILLARFLYFDKDAEKCRRTAHLHP